MDPQDMQGHSSVLPQMTTMAFPALMALLHAQISASERHISCEPRQDITCATAWC
jgi:hypothetical protein